MTKKDSSGYKQIMLGKEVLDIDKWLPERELEKLAKSIKKNRRV